MSAGQIMPHNIPRSRNTWLADGVIECKNRTIRMERIGTVRDCLRTGPRGDGRRLSCPRP